MLLSASLYAQTKQIVPDEKAKGIVKYNTILSPEQMHKDIDHAFHILSKVHANMYAFNDKKTIEKYKEGLYKACSEPMEAVEFNRRLHILDMLFDGHTGVHFPYWWQIKDNKDYFPVPVIVESGKIYLYDTDTQKKMSIVSINNEEVEDIYKRMVNQNEINAFHELHASKDFPRRLFLYTEIRPPFEVAVDNGNRIEILKLDGTTLSEGEQLYKGLKDKPRYDFRIYPEKSIAIIDYNTCGYSLNDEFVREELDKIFRGMFEQVTKNNIEHLFIDISRNGGGNTGTNSYILKHIQYNDTIKLAESVQRQYDPFGENGIYELNSLISSTYTSTYTPKKDGYSGNIYLIQGRASYSAAMGIAQWFENIRRAIIIGEETGQATAHYIDSRGYLLPETETYLGCSYKYCKDLPDGYESQGVLPDVPIKLDYNKIHYDLDNLLDFLKQIKAANL
jgi:hypothetical protein